MAGSHSLKIVNARLFLSSVINYEKYPKLSPIVLYWIRYRAGIRKRKIESSQMAVI